MAPFLYLWSVVFGAYFCSRRMVVVAYGWMVVTLAAGLILKRGELEVAAETDPLTGLLN